MIKEKKKERETLFSFFFVCFSLDVASIVERNRYSFLFFWSSSSAVAAARYLCV
jgi:hypothetical protein